MFSLHRLQVLSIILFGLLLTACGGGGGANVNSTAPVAKVVIQQTGLMLSSMGATKQLSAVAYDAEGNVLSVPISWSSTKTAISVDSTGKVTAASSNGSSQIVAEAESIKSATLIAIVTTFPVGAVLLTDAQIVGEPVATDPAAEPSFDNTYKVTLTGISAPALADLLINTESKPVVGRVVDVVTVGSQTTVTLAQVSLREAFPNLEINEVIDLSQAEIIFPADVTASYDIQRNGNNISFTPKAGAAAPVLLKSGAKTSNQPNGKTVNVAGVELECETTYTGNGSSLPIQLSVPPAFNITNNLSIDYVNTPNTGLERAVVKGGMGVKVEASVGVAIAFEGKAKCMEKELGILVVPLGNPAISMLVPINAGFEVGGKVTVATASLGLKGEANVAMELGVACPNGTNCAVVNSLTTAGSVTPVFDMPDIGDLRFEPALSGIAEAEIAIGNPFFTSLRFNALYAQAALKLAASFATPLSQIADTNYKSNYTLQGEFKAGVKLKFGDAMRLLGLGEINVAEYAATVDIGKSPTGTVTADHTTFVTGDVVKFHVALDLATLDFIPQVGPYNVRRILLVSNDGPLSTSVVASVNATPGQAEFDIPYTATRNGSVGEIFAFVDTKLLPSLDVLSLELGAAEAKNGRLRLTYDGYTCVQLDSEGVDCKWHSVGLTVTAEVPDNNGGFTPVSNLLLTLSATCGTLSATSGQTDALGQFSTRLNPDFACPNGANLHIVAKTADGNIFAEVSGTKDLED